MVRLLPDVRGGERRKQLVVDKKATFDSDAGRAVAGLWQQLYAQNLAGKEAYTGDAFADGTAAMASVGPWAIAAYKDKVDWGVVSVPTQAGSAEDQSTFSDAKNVALYTACTNRGTAWDFLKFSTSNEQDGKLLEMTGQMPLRQNLAQEYAGVLHRESAVQGVRGQGGPRGRGAERAGLGRDVAGLPGLLVELGDLRQGRPEQGARGRVREDQRPGEMTPSRPRHAERLTTGIFGRQPVGLLLSAPYAVFVAAVFAYPLGLAVWISFHKYIFTAPGVSVPRPFVGLDNYTAVLTDPAVRRSFLNILVFLVINVPLTVALSLLLATALNAAIPFRTFFRVSFYVPYVTASVAVVGVWLFLFSSGGLVNQVLGGAAPDPSWLINEVWAMPSIAFYVTWKQLGFFILLYLAALQNVPKELYESAAVDGASRWRSFRAVTIPGVRPATTLVTLLAIITGANLFTEPYLLTNGGGPERQVGVTGAADVPARHRAGASRRRLGDRRAPGHRRPAHRRRAAAAGKEAGDDPDHALAGRR